MAYPFTNTRTVMACVGATLSLLALAAACGSSDDSNGGSASSPDAPANDFDRAALLQTVGRDILLPVYRSFAGATTELRDATSAYCDALGAGGDGEAAALAAAQAAWREAMLAWQRAEVMLFGPAAMDEKALRDRIYSWPITSSCAVDQDVMLRYQDPSAFDIASRLDNRRGLAALEYLLFATSLDTTCPIQIAPEGWDALSDADKRAARCGLARDAAGDLVMQASVVVAAWAPESGNYLADFVNAGQSGSAFASAQEAINAVSDALFYTDSEVKDMKIGQPAGIVMNSCSTVGEPCPAELESPYADSSKENVIENLVGLRMVFRGDGPDVTGGIGFEDYLRAVGANALADTMLADIDAAIAAAEAIPGTMGTALAGNRDEVVAAHTAVKVVTDNLKSQFLTVLGLEIPDSAAADND